MRYFRIGGLKLVKVTSFNKLHLMLLYGNYSLFCIFGAEDNHGFFLEGESIHIFDTDILIRKYPQGFSEGSRFDGCGNTEHFG